MKVSVIPFQPHCFAFGGFEIQMISALQAAMSAGVDISPLDIWSRDANFSVLHLWGLEDSHWPTIFWAKKSGKAIVLTALLPYINSKIKFKYFIKTILGYNRIHKNIISAIDALVVVNKDQANTAEVLFKFPKEKIAIIPNIVDQSYFDMGEKICENYSNVGDYVICTGNISPRKNQLLLAKAAIETNTPLLIIGAVLPGEKPYALELKKIIDRSLVVRWIPGLSNGSSELKAAYFSAKAFALLSHNETQPISALEAAVLRKPLLLSSQVWAKQGVYKNALLVNPNSLAEIKMALVKIRSMPINKDLNNDLILCNHNAVGKAYALVYKKVFDGLQRK